MCSYLFEIVKAVLVDGVSDANFELDSGARRALVRVASGIDDDTCTCVVRVCVGGGGVGTRTDDHHSPGTTALECGTSGSGGSTSTSGSSTSTSGGLACRWGLSTGAARARGGCRGVLCAARSRVGAEGHGKTLRVRRRGSRRLRVDPHSATVPPASLTRSFPNCQLLQSIVFQLTSEPRKTRSNIRIRTRGPRPPLLLPTHTHTPCYRPEQRILSLFVISIVCDNDYVTIYYFRQCVGTTWGDFTGPWTTNWDRSDEL